MSARRQPPWHHETQVLFGEAAAIRNSPFKKDRFQNVALGANGSIRHFQGFCWAVAAGDALFSSPTTHRPSHKTGGKNAVVLKIKPCCVATYCMNFLWKKNFFVKKISVLLGHRSSSKNSPDMGKKIDVFP